MSRGGQIGRGSHRRPSRHGGRRSRFRLSGSRRLGRKLLPGARADRRGFGGFILRLKRADPASRDEGRGRVVVTAIWNRQRKVEANPQGNGGRHAKDKREGSRPAPSESSMVSTDNTLLADPDDLRVVEGLPRRLAEEEPETATAGAAGGAERRVAGFFTTLLTAGPRRIGAFARASVSIFSIFSPRSSPVQKSFL